MSWSIQQVAKLSGVTARTLRYYDEIGLLPPAGVAANGYRSYDEVGLARLQEILLLRELGLDLTAIGAVLDGDRDRLGALRTHLAALRTERDRLDALVGTVTATIAHLEEGSAMPADEMFAGFRFDRDRIDALEALAVERSGESEQPHFDQLRANTADWSDQQFRAAERAGQQTELRLLALLEDGAAPDDPRVVAVLADDRTAQQQLLELSADDYAKLGRAFASAPELRAHLDARDPRLAGFMSAAMVNYATTQLG